MNRLDCLEKSSAGLQTQVTAAQYHKKQPPVESVCGEHHKLKDTMEEKTVADKLHKTMPARGLPCSVHGIQIPGAQSEDVLNTGEYETKESVNLTPRVGEQTVASLVLDEELRVKDCEGHPSPLVEIVGPIPTCEEELTEEASAEDEDVKAPVELIIKFVRALMDRDYQLAHKLCQMILIYEPENPEASEFLPLIQRLLEKQEAEQSDEEEDDSDTDDDDSGSEDESSQSSCSSSSCSSSSPSDDDEEEETQSNRHEPGPPSYISP